MNTKMESKDLVSIGIFTALLMLATLIVASLQITPILQLLMTPIVALVSAPIYLLFVARVGKPFAITIMGIMCSLLTGLLVFGNVYMCLVNLSFFVVADLIANIGKYKSFKINAISYIVLGYWTTAESMTYWFFPEYILKLSNESGIPESQTLAVLELATTTNSIIIVVAIFVAGVISICFAKGMFKKHFKRAGLITESSVKKS